MIFPTGYSANVGVIAGLMRSGDLIVADQYAHASHRRRHDPVEGQEPVLPPQPAPRIWTGSSRGFEGKKLVIVEGVYSMDGDMPPLPEIVEVAKRTTPGS